MSRGFDFRDKVAVVTGASSGIGREAALALGRKGCRVVLAARRRELLDDVAARIASGGGRAMAMVTDVSRPEDVEHLVKEVLNQWGRIDIFIANAGTLIQKPVTELSIEDFERIMRVNFFGALHGIRAVLPQMLKQGSGCLMTVSSMIVKKALPQTAAYSAAKFALSGFADALRQELRGTGVSVVDVLPGRIDTPMLDNLRLPRISPKIPAKNVARAMIRGIRKNKAKVVVPRSFIPLLLLDQLSPRFGDWFVRAFHIAGWPVDPNG